MKLSGLLLFLLMAESATALPELKAKPDTLPVKASQRTKSTSRLAPARITMPGTRLDTNFRTIPAQRSVVGKAAPAWLRAKGNGSPMYIVNGKGATAAQLRALRQTDVASIHKLDGSRAAGLYGKNARNGVVIITTKSGLIPKK